jgi:hypothetical protein
MKMTAIIRVEYEALPGFRENVLRAALTRGLGAFGHAIEHGVDAGSTGIRECSTRWDVMEQKCS